MRRFLSSLDILAWHCGSVQYWVMCMILLLFQGQPGDNGLAGSHGTQGHTVRPAIQHHLSILLTNIAIHFIVWLGRIWKHHQWSMIWFLNCLHSCIYLGNDCFVLVVEFVFLLFLLLGRERRRWEKGKHWLCWTNGEETAHTRSIFHVSCENLAVHKQYPLSDDVYILVTCLLENVLI